MRNIIKEIYDSIDLFITNKWYEWKYIPTVEYIFHPKELKMEIKTLTGLHKSAKVDGKFTPMPNGIQLTAPDSNDLKVFSMNEKQFRETNKLLNLNLDEELLENPFVLIYTNI